VNKLNVDTCVMHHVKAGLPKLIARSIVVNSYTDIRKHFLWRDSKRRWFPHAVFSDIERSVTEWLHVYSLSVDVLQIDLDQ
jgi:hypothetical protein